MNLLQKLARRGRRLLQRVSIPGHRYASVSYAQSGEDIIIRNIFATKAVWCPSFLDIGAHHPYLLSNTALLYQSGSRGINIEPNPDLLEAFRNERPEDINLNVGIAAQDGVKDFYRMQDPTLSTFSEEEMNALVSHGETLRDKTQLPVISMPTLIATHWQGRFPDLLTIDVEGMEQEILSGIHFEENGPKVICVETAEYSPSGTGAKRRPLMDFIESKGYLLYADTNLNSIYVNREFWLNPARTAPGVEVES